MQRVKIAGLSLVAILIARYLNFVLSTRSPRSNPLCLHVARSARCVKRANLPLARLERRPAGEVVVYGACRVQTSVDRSVESCIFDDANRRLLFALFFVRIKDCKSYVNTIAFPGVD